MVKSKLTALDFRRADFGFFKDLLGRVPCGTSWWEIGIKKAG